MQQFVTTITRDPFITKFHGEIEQMTPVSLRMDETNRAMLFRNFTKRRKEINWCIKNNRNYYYIDCGYFGNSGPKKMFHRIVKNNIQHENPRYDLPSDRFDDQCRAAERVQHSPRFKGRKKDGRAILVAPVSNKSCTFYGYTLNQWLDHTLAELKKHTDRPIIVRERPIRQLRIQQNSIYHQFDKDNIFALVTYNSLAATEAIGYGIPTFTSAPCAANAMCSQDLSKIETPYYPDEDKVRAWQNWLAYCQFRPHELATEVPLKIIDSLGLN